VRRSAIKQIRSSPAEPTKAALRAILNGDVEGSWNDRVRVNVAVILTTWKDEQTGKVDTTGLPELIEALRGPDDGLRRLAAEVLWLVGAPAVPHVKDVLRSGQQANRMEAAVILGRMVEENQEATAGEALLGFPLGDEESPEVRMAVVINVSAWRSPRAVAGLMDGLTDPDLAIRSFCWDRIKERCRPPVAFNPRDDFAPRAEAIQKLRAWWKDEQKTAAAR
jgi:HEAT repeat protein